MLRNNWGFRFKYRSRGLLNGMIARYGGNGIYNLKGEHSQKDKHALVIYTAQAISKYLRGSLSSLPSINSHSGFNESVAMLNVLLELGYTVDYFDLFDPPKIEWGKYQLIVDAGNNIENGGNVNGQKKIFYSTSCHWKTFHDNVFKHIDSFHKRNGLLMTPDRELKPNYSAEAADIITGFGGSYQAKSFLTNQNKFKQLNISTTFLPSHFEKKISTKNKFIWFGGYGSFHKGLDLAVEAFLKMPEMELHVFGNLESNKPFQKWFNKTTANSKNISYHGWISPENKIFQDHVQKCDGLIFTSSSEGGAGSIIQGMQFGLIPLVNKATALDLKNDSFNIGGNNPEEEIESLVSKVNAFHNMDSFKLQEHSLELKKQYCDLNTLDMYSKSLKEIIRTL